MTRHRPGGRRTPALTFALAAVWLAAVIVPTACGSAGESFERAGMALSPALTKYQDPLPIPSVMQPLVPGGSVYEVDMRQVQQQLHSDLPPTTVWGYQGVFPGPTFETRTGQPVTVRWTNSLPTTHILPVNHTLPDYVHHEETHGKPLPDVRTVVHRHGGLQDGESDGGPDDWFTPGSTEVGDSFTTQEYVYPNHQPAATLWYHDHAAGATRLNVYAGLAGFFIVRDDEEDALNLPKGAYEVPIVIQDRIIEADGSLWYPAETEGDVEGDVAVVNGKAWPYLEVEPRKYRFRFLNGSNAREYDLSLSSGQPMWQIATDTGLMARPVRTRKLSLKPGERADVVVDFRDQAGQKIVLRNTDGGEFPLPEIMQLRVKAGAVVDTSSLPGVLRTLERYDPADAVVTRTVTLEHEENGDGATVFLLDGKFRHDAPTEFAKADSIEVWNFVNLAGDSHPMHLHLSDFQVLGRREIDARGYHEALMAWRAGEGPEPVLADFFTDDGWQRPRSGERGNKDTVEAPSDMVTRVVVRFGPDTGETVWHCHVLEHEDNDMMRPLIVEP